MNILIVDDERDQLDSLRRGLRSRQHHTVEALNASAAMTALQAEAPIDLVITDYAMPGASGIDLLDWIRKKQHDLPVIMMTAFGDKQLVVQALNNHCNGYLDKPFTLVQLLSEIEKVTNHQQSRSRLFSDTLCRLAHQINNPLMAIIGSAELSLEDHPEQLAADTRNRLDNIVAAAQRINVINRKIMGLGRIFVEPPVVIDIWGLINQCLEMYTDLTKLKKIDVTLEGGPTKGRIVGSTFAIEQMFKNILLNAVESMDGCNIRQLSIQINEDPIRKFIEVCIHDSGCGIAPKHLGRIFDPYYTSKSNGNGIGLAVVKSIVERSNGSVSVESELGAGTRFKVRLPYQ